MRSLRISHGALAALIAVATLSVGTLALFLVSFEVAMVVFVVGWFFLVPAVGILGEEVDFDTAEPEDETDPIDELRRRYAEGELDDAEFERRLDALLDTEDLDVDDVEGIENAIDRIGASNATDESDATIERE